MAETILIVDDNRVVLESLRGSLEAAGFEVQSATDGDRAVSMVLRLCPDLIISDIQMPNLDGFFFCQIMRSRPETRDIPFIFLTSMHGPSKRMHGFKIGADDFIPKPFEGEEVVLRVRNLLRRVGRHRDAHPAPNTSLSGALATFPLTDLLQLLGVNRKDARIEVEAPQGRAELQVGRARVVSAIAGEVHGIKAFERILAWREGRFTLDYDPSIDLPTDDLGHVDTLSTRALIAASDAAACLARLGGMDARLAPGSVDSGGLDSKARALLEALGTDLRVSELLDAFPETDAKLLATLATLLEQGHILTSNTPADD